YPHAHRAVAAVDAHLGQRTSADRSGRSRRAGEPTCSLCLCHTGGPRPTRTLDRLQLQRVELPLVHVLPRPLLVAHAEGPVAGLALGEARSHRRVPGLLELAQACQLALLGAALLTLWQTLDRGL